LTSRHASLKLVEECWQKMIEYSQLKKILSQEEQIKCWKWSLKRLCHEGSFVMLNVDDWWQDVWSALDHSSALEQNKCLSYFVDGASKALENTGLLKNKIKYAHKIVQLLDK
jgi:hypothetical protein